jgi:hypothetical protein
MFKKKLDSNHISGNKIRIGPIEVPFDRADPDAQPVKFPHRVMLFLPTYPDSMVKKTKNRHSRAQIGTRECDTRPQILNTRPTSWFYITSQNFRPVRFF